MHHSLALIVILICGLAFGSFIDAYVWRTHKRLTTKKLDKKYSILLGRSICPKCEHQLAGADLVPIFSYLYLKGKCRYCKADISPLSPIVEVATVALFGLSYIYWPMNFHGAGLIDFVFWLVFLVNFLALAVYDIKWLTLPNRMVYPLFGLIALQILIAIVFYGHHYSYILSHLIGLAIGGGIFYVLYQVSNGKWIGGGDVRLGALLGLVLGSGLYSFFMIFLSSLLGTIYAIPMLSRGKIGKKSMIPYGPFLIAAAIIIELFGHSLVNWLKARGLDLGQST